MRENDLYKEVSKLAMPDFDKTKQNIVSAETKKFPIKSVVAVAACLVAAVGAVALSQNFRNTPPKNPTGQNAVLAHSIDGTFPATNPDLNTEPDYNDKIVYNKIGAYRSADLACVCDEKPYALASYKDIIRVIPERLTEMYYEELYVVPDELSGTEAIQKEENYTELHTCLLSFIKPDSATRIEIGFSKKGTPLRDCFYEGGKKMSNISGVDVLLNGDPNDKVSMCIATFKIEEENETLWFDIEFSEITEEEMLSVLRTVISMAKSNKMSTEPATEPAEGVEFNLSELISQAHTTEAPVTSQGNTIDIDDEDELNRPDDVLTVPAYDPSEDMP